MIKKIIFSGIFFCLIVAVFLSIAGVKYVEPGPAFMSLVRSVNESLNKFKIEIPDIPTIKPLEEAKGAWLIVDILIKICNFFVYVINILADLINIIIKVIEFICLFLWHIGYFIGFLVGGGSSVNPGSLSIS